MIVKKIIDFDMDQNCYVINKEKNGDCIVIDPGGSTDKLKSYLIENKLNPKAVLLTHCHYDHTSGLEELKKNFDFKVFSSSECSENIKNPVLNVSEMFGKSFSGDYVDCIVGEEEFSVCGLSIKCIKTPGHTDGSVCYLIENNLFTGDTLFLRSVGRWDLPTGSYNSLVSSLRDKIYKMDDEIKVLPGHGNDTSVGYEKKFNMSINGQR